MSYEKIRKNHKGGKLIPKFQTPAGSINNLYTSELDKILNDPNIDYETWSAAQRLKAGTQIGYGSNFDFNGISTSVSQSEVGTFLGNYKKNTIPGNDEVDAYEAEKEAAELALLLQETPKKLDDAILNANVTEEERARAEERAKNTNNINNPFDPVTYQLKADSMKKFLSSIGIIGPAITTTLNAVDESTMGDKNFSTGSQAIDATVHGVSGALMKSGNPYAMAAGVALEGLNFITKAGGKTVPGFDVNINNSGYGNMGRMESESGRIWNNMNNKLAKRNEQARMALTAQNVSQEQDYEQEARANSVTNILQLNQIALAGGIDPSLLAS